MSIPAHIQDEIIACGFELTPEQIHDGTIPPNVMETLLKRSEARKDTCPITDEPIQADSSILTPCGHYFSKPALKTWTDTHNSCPVCRATISKIARKFTLIAAFNAATSFGEQIAFYSYAFGPGYGGYFDGDDFEIPIDEAMIDTIAQSLLPNPNP
jgi:hypothetical protein